MLLLCIETSCDETSAAVVAHGRQVLGQVIASQDAIHSRFGGVVPELASRTHLARLPDLVTAVLEQAQIEPQQLEGVAATQGPGLIGALLVGLSWGQSYAFARGLPFIGVHHIEGHILAPLLEQQVAFPYIALAVSGGHTHLYRVDGIGRYRLLGRTLDDAAGEAFDKVAKLLGLGYPGGRHVDEWARQGQPQAFELPRPMLKRDNLDFSFSGLKTKVSHLVQQHTAELEKGFIADVAASFQAAMVEVLTVKALRALQQENLQRLVVAGGVACNQGLRRSLQQQCPQVVFPSPRLCSDNAAMLAVAADHYLGQGQRQKPGADARARWPLADAG